MKSASSDSVYKALRSTSSDVAYKASPYKRLIPVFACIAYTTFSMVMTLSNKGGDDFF